MASIAGTTCGCYVHARCAGEAGNKEEAAAQYSGRRFFFYGVGVAEAGGVPAGVLVATRVAVNFGVLDGWRVATGNVGTGVFVDVAVPGIGVAERSSTTRTWAFWRISSVVAVTGRARRAFQSR